MRRRDRIETRLALLALTATIAVSAVGAVALLTVVGVAHDGSVLADAQQLLSQQQAADQSHDALRADVFAAMQGAAVDRAEVQAQAARDAQELRDGLAANVSQLAGLNDPALRREYAQTRDQLDAYATASEHLVALSSDRAAAQRALPGFNRQFGQARQLMADLTRALRAQTDRAYAASNRAARRGQLRTAEIVGLALLVLLGLTVAVRRSVRASLAEKAAADSAVLRANAQLTGDAAREHFDATLKDAFEMAVSEPEAQEVVRRAVAEVVPGRRAELLLADNSRAHLARVITEPGAAAPGCGVLTPAECVAVRRGRPAVFANAEGIGACPKLAGRGTPILQAVCAPVTFLGEGLGVLHVIAGPGEQLGDDAIRALSVTAEHAGNRIGTLRAFSRSQLQANTDGLTGLLNRRTAEERAGKLQREGRSMAVALCDLDHFKQVNDTFGHEAGDRALRVFSATLRSVMRSEDIVARYGGEEFLLVMPDCGQREAQEILSRVRTELVLTLQGGGAPTFTASFGLAQAEPTQPLDEVVRCADAALMQAKHEGRDRVVSIGPTPPEPNQPSKRVPVP